MPDHSYEHLLKQAYRLQEDGDIRGALELWREIARRCPDCEALCSLADAAYELGEIEEAEAALLRAVSSDPALRLPHTMLCRTAMSRGRWEDVEDHARQALRIEEDGDVYNLLGIALDALDRHEEACAAYTRGIELDPSYEVLHCNFGQLVGESDPAKAEVLFSQAIELRPDYAEAHRELGSLLLRQKVIDEAEYHLRRAIDLDPADPWAHLYLGNLLETKRDFRSATLEFQWAYQSAPNWAVTMWCLADSYAAQEEWSKAEDLYNRALGLEPDNVPANRGLAKMYMSMGRTELAEVYLSRVLLLEPNDKSALDCMERITGDYVYIPRKLVHRLQRRRPRWQRRQDPEAL